MVLLQALGGVCSTTGASELEGKQLVDKIRHVSKRSESKAFVAYKTWLVMALGDGCAAFVASGSRTDVSTPSDGHRLQT